MKISTESWHFTLWRFTHTFTEKKDYQIEEPTSLWRYIWRLILVPVPTVCVIAVMVIVGGGLMGSIILARNLYTILTFQGISWFNLTDSNHRDEPAFKWAWEFKWINQKPRNASWWAKFFWLNIVFSLIVREMVLYLGYHHLEPYLWLMGGVQALTLYLCYFIWQSLIKPKCKKYWSALIPQVHFMDPEDDYGKEDSREGRDWV